MAKKIGILTSGGDCGGLNAAIRSIFYRAKNKYNMDVVGIKDGTAGLMKRPVAAVQLTHKTFGGYLLRQGGTFLGSTKINLTSAGCFLYNIDVIIALIPTDLPCPVAPATNRCGILVKSVTKVSLLIVLPRAKGNSISAS